MYKYARCVSIVHSADLQNGIERRTEKVGGRSCLGVNDMLEMKKTGIYWIGKIPSRWVRGKIKNVCSMIGSGTTPSSNITEFYDDGNINWIQSGDIYGKSEIESVSVQITKKALLSSNSLKIYYAPYIVIAMYGGSVGNTAISYIDACTNQACCCLKPSENIDFKFLYYWILLCKEDFLLKAEGGGQPNISQDKIKNQWIYLPPIREQGQIAKFLNEKCAEIDTLSTDIQIEIDTLEEYKRSIITEIVTKGLEPDVKMKDSGIKWAGTIPASWNVHPVYYHFGERKAKNYDLQEQNLLSLSYGRVIRKDINTNGGLLPANFSTYNIVEAGDIIIRPTDLQNDKRSLRTGLVTEHGIITSAYIALMPKPDVNSKYFRYLLYAYDLMKVFYNMGNGVRQGLNYSEFSKLMVVTPPKEEQQQIANYLDSKCIEIDSIIEIKRKQLVVLDKYKKSMIYEYVTGKKLVI